MSLFVAYIVTALVFSFVNLKYDNDRNTILSETLWPRDDLSLSLNIFRENLLSVLDQNNRFQKNMSSFSSKLNHFSKENLTDLTQTFSKQFHNKNWIQSRRHIELSITREKSVLTLPLNVDWRKYGIVSSVGDQGSCGACWSFATVGALESHIAKINNKPVTKLSVQEMVDCSTDNFGCEGGVMEYAYNYMIRNTKITKDASYPYKGIKSTCKRLTLDMYDKSNTFTVEGFAYVNTSRVTDEDKMESKLDWNNHVEEFIKGIVATRGPVSAAIEVKESLMQYSSGIYDVSNCTESGVNHAVLIVGYGEDKEFNNKPYWIVKNSWGQAWGENGGYFRIARNSNNMCGISEFIFFPLLKRKD